MFIVESTYRWLLVLTVVLTVPAGRLLAEDKTFLDYPEWNGFPKGMDSEDETEMMRYQSLVEKGESAYAGLMAIVRECDDFMFIGRALSIMTDSQGDKREVVGELKTLLGQRLPKAEGDEEWTVYFMANAIAKMGVEEDLMALIPMLGHPGRIVRRNGILLLSEFGGADTLAALEQARQQSQDRNPTERVAIDEAISAIEKRLGKEAE